MPNQRSCQQDSSENKKSAHVRACDWCGRPAAVRVFRMTNEGTEAEQVSVYYECERCAKMRH